MMQFIITDLHWVLVHIHCPVAKHQRIWMGLWADDVDEDDPAIPDEDTVKLVDDL